MVLVYLGKGVVVREQAFRSALLFIGKGFFSTSRRCQV